MRDEVWSPIVWEKYECKEERFSVLGECGADPQPGMKGKRLLGSDSTVLQAYVLGLSYKD